MSVRPRARAAACRPAAAGGAAAPVQAGSTGPRAVHPALRSGLVAFYDFDHPMPGDPALEHVSSALVKEVARFGGDVTGLVPDEVRDALVARQRADR